MQIKNHNLISFIPFLIKNLIRLFPLIHALAMRDLQSRYKGSVLGFLWTFANPVLMVTIYSVVFKGSFHASISNYPTYVLSSILLWQTWSTILIQAPYCFIHNKALVTRAAVAPEVIVSQVVISSYFNYILSLPLYFICAAVFHVSFTWKMLQIFWLLPLGFLFIFFISMCLSVLGAFYKDVQNLTNTLVFALFFTVPVMYPLSVLPKKAILLLSWSPFTQLISMQSKALFFGQWISWQEYGIFFIGFFILGIISLWVFNKLRNFVAEQV